MRQLYLIRHAKAAGRDNWPPDDATRPLTAAGQRQAESIAEHLSGRSPADSPTRILSSPAVRCCSTMEPLGRRLGLATEVAEWLAEGAAASNLVPRLREMPDEVVAACTHGDVIWDVLEWLASHHLDLGSHPDAPKAGIWLIEWAPEPGGGKAGPAEARPGRATFV
ncbi:MAG: SixA phosphatase family protein, partial [Acidimicrobiales bacterium]